MLTDLELKLAGHLRGLLTVADAMDKHLTEKLKYGYCNQQGTWHSGTCELCQARYLLTEIDARIVA